MWLLFFIVGGLAAYLLLRNSKKQSSPASDIHTGKADIPSKVLVPANFTSHKDIIAWEFVTPNLSTACNYARNHAGIRRTPQECVALPLVDCSSSTCLCHYRPVYDSRKQQRREHVERRESFRFADNVDRRSTVDRRKEQTDWQDKHLK
ncbi:MAG TPA: hypothetical protein VN247_06715 [Arenimonas sp.]|nr:hypothetical protein [Arenimonas sp.]